MTPTEAHKSLILMAPGDIVVGVQVTFSSLWRDAEGCAHCNKPMCFSGWPEFNYCPFCGKKKSVVKIQQPAHLYDGQGNVGGWSVRQNPGDTNWVLVGRHITALTVDNFRAIQYGMENFIKEDMYEATKAGVPPEWASCVRSWLCVSDWNQPKVVEIKRI